MTAFISAYLAKSITQSSAQVLDYCARLRVQISHRT